MRVPVSLETGIYIFLNTLTHTSFSFLSLLFTITESSEEIIAAPMRFLLTQKEFGILSLSKNLNKL